jgi:hypothetical protein
MPKPAVDRRQHARLILESEAELTLNNQTNGSYIQNISRGGALVYCNHQTDVSQSGILHLQMIDNKEVNIDLKVKSIKPLTERRRTVLEIGKNISFSTVLSVQFNQLVDERLFDNILKEC